MKRSIQKQRSVALVEWAWSGHHATYFTHFAAALAEEGHQVVPFCPNPEDFAERLSALRLDDSVMSRVGNAESLPPLTRWVRILPPAWREKAKALLFFGSITSRLHAWERRTSRDIDLAFFTCVYDHTFQEFRFAERLFGYPWAGLYLHVRSFRMPGSPVPYIGGLPCPEKFFSSRALAAIAVLDEGAVAPLKKITGGKPVVVFPDLTSNEVPSPGTSGWGLADKADTLARGRPALGLDAALPVIGFASTDLSEKRKGFGVLQAALERLGASKVTLLSFGGGRAGAVLRSRRDGARGERGRLGQMP